MTPLSDSVINVLQSALSLEVAAMENLHTNEHLWQRKGYKKIKKRLDKLVGKCRNRKRVLIDRIFLLDGSPDTSGGATALYPNITDLLTYVLSTHQKLNDAYQNAVGVVKQVDDSVAEDLLNDAQADLQGIIGKYEKELTKLSEVGGEAAYLATL